LDTLLRFIYYIFRLIINFIIKIYIIVIIEVVLEKTGKIILLNKDGLNSKVYRVIGAIFWTIFAIILYISLAKKGLLPPLF
jgi:hypothetical protein